MSIDWSTLQEPFERMCRTLLSTLGLHVESDPTEGLSQPVLLLPDEVPPLRVVCMAASAGADSVSPHEMLGPLARLARESTGPLVVLTNALLPEPSKRALERIARAGTPVSIGYVEGRHLERLLLCSRQVYRQCFKQEPILGEDLRCNELRHARAFCDFVLSSRFLQKDTTLDVAVSNVGPAPLDLVVTADGNTVATLTVATFGRQTLTISPEQLDPKAWDRLEVRPANAPATSLTVEKAPERPRVPIDHIYVDPLGWCDTVKDALTTSGVIYLSGGPGTGKSRLLREVCHGRLRPAWIDLSEGSYGTAFVDHLLARVFDLDLPTLRKLPDDFLLLRLEQLGCDEIGTQALLRYVKEDLETLGMQAFAGVLADLTEAAFNERVLVVDNIHRLRHLDAELLRALLTRPRTAPVIITARDQEIEDPEVTSLLEWGAQKEGFLRLTLDQLPTARLIDRFLAEATADESSRKFLSVLKHAKNMQEFMLAIKSFKARSLIEQEDNGRLRVGFGGTRIHMAEYGKLLADMLDAIGGGAQTEALRGALEAAACFGYSFAPGFLREALGSSADPLMDLLMEKELLTEGSEGTYKFDHELTRDIVWASIPFSRKERLHRRVITYLEERAQVADAEALSEHYEVVLDYGRSADYALSAAAFKVQRSSLADGSEQYRRALTLAEKYRLDSQSLEDDARSYVLEAHSLEGLIDTTYQVRGYRSVYDLIRQLDVLMKLYPHDHSDCLRLRGRVDFYFGRHFNLAGDNRKGRRYLDRSIEILRKADAPAELGDALARACTLEKNCCRFEEAECLGQEAVEILAKAAAHEKLANALICLGAVFLEAGDPARTVPFWKRAVDAVTGRASQQVLCATSVDYSYILALVTPESLDAERELEATCGLTQRFGLEQQEARARLNFANWIFFHGSPPSAAREHLARADELIRSIQDGYLRHLHSFSLLNMDLVASNERQRLEAAIEEEACHTVETQGSLTATGDNRVANMIEYLALRGSPRALRLVPVPEGQTVADYYSGLTNPYRRDDVFITLY